jgi:arsenate reductase
MHKEPQLNILFLCTSNSCRSILAEATFNALAPAYMYAMSAGSQPTGKVHPRSLALLKREGISTNGHYSKSWNNLPVTPDIVITVCANAAGETCPAYLGDVIRAHWAVDDPVKATGARGEMDAAFERAYRTLRRRIETFLTLPLSDLIADKSALAKELARIGTL